MTRFVIYDINNKVVKNNMIQYNPDSLYSFKCPCHIERELRLRYVPDGRRHEVYFWCESGGIPGVFVLPESVLVRTKDNSPHGFLGKAKPGKFYDDDNIEVSISDVNQVYNGSGYATLTYTKTGTRIMI